MSHARGSTDFAGRLFYLPKRIQVMDEGYTTLGTLTPDGSIELDEPFDLPPGRIELTVRRFFGKPGHSIWDVLPHCPAKRSGREIDAHLNNLRDEWNP